MALVEHPQESAVRRKTAAFLLVCVMVLLVGLGGRIAYINIELRDRLLSRAEQQRRGSSVAPARRGMILDRRGRVVAATEFLPDVFVDTTRVEDAEALSAKLGPPLNLPPERIKEKILARAGSQYVVLATRVDEVTVNAIQSLNERAVGLDEKPVRSYPLGTSMAHVIGWAGRDGTGMEGIELSFDQHLHGKDGRRGTIRDARRRGIMAADDEAVAPVDGGHVLLTIDAEIQRIAEVALARSVETVRAQSGVAVVMAPATGEILAMASYPTFDPAEASQTPADVRRNRAVTDPIEPGSTFKVFIAGGAMDGSFVSLTEKIDCKLGHTFFGRREIKDVHPHGMLDLKGILTFSSNIGMVTIALRMGNPALHHTVRKFGFGTKTGIEYPGESDGLVYPLRKWGNFSTHSVAMGYELLVTPLQLASAFSAIVNDGMLLKPKLMRQLLGADGKVVRNNELPVVVDRAISSETARRMTREILPAVVEDGSGKAARLEDYRVLGKTGTAKLAFKDRPGYEPGQYMGAFLAAAPLREAGVPDVAVVVMIRRPDPSLGYYGGAVAAPVAGEIIQRSLAYMGVPPSSEAVADTSAP